jgi:hypothetical protein
MLDRVAMSPPGFASTGGRAAIRLGGILGLSVRAALVGALRDQAAQFVLDNVEHAHDAAPPPFTCVAPLREMERFVLHSGV